MAWGRKPKRRAWGVYDGIIKSQQTEFSDLSEKVAMTFMRAYDQITHGLKGDIVSRWADAELGPEVRKLKEHCPRLWKSMHKMTEISGNDGNTYTLPFQIPYSQNLKIYFDSTEVMAVATPEQQEQMDSANELLKKASRLRQLLGEWLHRENFDHWGQVVAWNADLKHWVKARPQIKPRKGGPPSNELYALLRQASVLRAAQQEVTNS